MTESPTRLAGVGRSREPALQRIGRGTVANLTDFGRSLRKHAVSELDWFAERFDHGFLDGGCRMFAQALVDWSGEDLRLRAVVRTGEMAIQHYVASDGFTNLDADGAATDGDMIRKMALVEDCPDCEMRCDINGLTAHAIPYDASVAAAITAGLRRTLGSWPGPWLMTALREGRKEASTWSF